MSLEQQNEQEVIERRRKRLDDLHKWLKTNPELESTEKMYEMARLLGIAKEEAQLLADAFSGRLTA